MFTVRPVAEDYVALQSCETVRRALVQAFRGGTRVAVLTGEAGTGKSMLVLRTVLSLQPKLRHVAYLNSSPCRPDDLMHQLALAFGMPQGLQPGPLPAQWLEDTLAARKAQRALSMLVLEEAQHLSDEALASLFGWYAQQRRLGMRLLLLGVGLPPLATRWIEHCAPPELQLRPLALRLLPLDAAATKEYVCVSWRRGGHWGAPALEREALNEIYRRTAGVLGRIQRLAARTLQTAEIFGLQTIDAATVAEQADDLGLPVYGDRLDCAEPAATRPTLPAPGTAAAAPAAPATRSMDPPAAQPADPAAPHPAAGLTAAAAPQAGPALPGMPSAELLVTSPPVPAPATSLLPSPTPVPLLASTLPPVQPASAANAAPGRSALAVGGPLALLLLATLVWVLLGPRPTAEPPPGSPAQQVPGAAAQDTAQPGSAPAAPATAPQAAATAEKRLPPLPWPASAPGAGPGVARPAAAGALSGRPAEPVLQARPPSPACSQILVRFSLGESLSDADRATLARECR